MAVDSLLRALAALVVALCGIGLIGLAVLLPFSLEGFEVDKADISLGSVLFLTGCLAFLFGSGLFLLFISVNHFRREKS